MESSVAVRSDFESGLLHDNRRDGTLKSLRFIINQWFDHQAGSLDAAAFVQLFSRKDVVELLFVLFDYEGQGRIQQRPLFNQLRAKLKNKDGQTFTDLLETVTYVMVGDGDLDEEQFYRVVTSKSVLEKLFHCLGTSSVEKLMTYIMQLTFARKNSHITEDDLKCVEENFRKHMSKNEDITLEDFKKMMGHKRHFFAERVFEMFDKDGSGRISLTEFMQSVQQYCGKSIEDKARFLFQIYDINGDGLIRVGELKSVLQACMEENGMKFSDEHLEDLTEALYEDANPEGSDGITFEQLTSQLKKHDGLLQSLSINIDKWLCCPMTTNKTVTLKTSSKLSMAYVKNNIVFLSFLFFYFTVNVILYVEHAMQFWEFHIGEGHERVAVQRNYFYMLARGAGQLLNFNGMFVLVLMLRRSITFLRERGLANVLPLDQHVYLHKVVGTVIAFLSIFHGAMHTCNFVFNVADRWVIDGRTYSISEWLFTTKPGVYGLIPGVANITGWALLIIALIISISSLPFVRKGGNFEIFRWMHCLSLPFWVLMIFHEKNFWLWLLVPGSIYLLEVLWRVMQIMSGKGKTFVSTAVLLPSRVTHLVIKRPKNFDYHPGDYVFINVPTIASSEWHPFTISSAPEQQDSISLHIRGVGGWTNRLYQFFENQQQHLSHDVCDYKDSHGFALRETNKSKVRRLPTSSTPNQQPIGSYRYSRRQPVIINVGVPEESQDTRCEPKALGPRASYAPETAPNRSSDVFLPMEPDDGDDEVDGRVNRKRETEDTPIISLPEKSTALFGDGTNAVNSVCRPLKVIIDGPYGAPSSHIFHAEHAVLIAAGIGVTPFASILQSIMHRYWNSKQHCPNCKYSWNNQMPESIRNLKKVDFFWINREQRSFEWFVNLLTQLEIEQAEKGGVLDRFLDMHMYITSGLQRTDLKAVGLQLALDLLYNKDKRDLITGLKTRTKAGRPNWDKVFQQLQDQDKGRVTVFYCGPPQLGSELSKKCADFGFTYRKEVF